AYGLFALAAGVTWLLSATAWVRVGRRGLLWRHLGRVQRIAWEGVTGCACIWVEQGRKPVRVVAVEVRAEELVLLWPTAWIGEPNRRALVEVVQRRRQPALRSPA
nr:hypothetical protein [Actinomycetota bacterium]